MAADDHGPHRQRQLPADPGIYGGDDGVQRTTISHMAANLKRAGVISYSRGQLIILDREALIEHACECYHRSCSSSPICGRRSSETAGTSPFRRVEGP